jgi:hypothetical protein
VSAVWLRASAQLRGRARATLLLAVLVGLAGGMVLAAVAGARRTDAALPRFLARDHAADAIIFLSDAGQQIRPDQFVKPRSPWRPWSPASLSGSPSGGGLGGWSPTSSALSPEVVPLAVELGWRPSGDQAASSLAGVTVMLSSSALRSAGRCR